MTRPPGRDVHILVVDDDAAVREALSAALATRYVVYTAASGADACTILRTHPVAAIILDAVLRHEHGLDLIEKFRKLSSAQIVILTGHGTEDLAVRALRARVDEYLKKPVALPALHEILERLIPQGHRTSELIARACQYLEGYPPKEFRPVELASQMGVGEAHLRRVFREACGKTPRQYVTGIRIRRAANLLRTTDHSIKRIAADVGYTNLKLFRRAFVRIMGMQPQAWRRCPHGVAAEGTVVRSDVQK